jgi:hypothetical protein
MAGKERPVLVALITTAGVVIAALIAAGYLRRPLAPPAPDTAQTSTTTASFDSIGDTAVTDSVQSHPTERLPRVVMQVAKGDPRTLADQIRRKLLRAGHDVPAIVPVDPHTTPSVVEVRYFRDAERAKGDFVVDELKQLGVEARLSYRGEFASTAPLNQVEIWLPKRPSR